MEYMDEKIKFIEETEVKKKAEKTSDFKHSNPIKANLMKFVHLKLDDAGAGGARFAIKKDFE